jgi:hypothetical protein
MSYSWFVKAFVASQAAKNGISSEGPSLFNSDVTVDGAVISKANIVNTPLPDDDTDLVASNLIDGYYTTTTLWSADHTLTLPTAAQIIAAIPNCQAGSSFKFTINNTSGQDATLTGRTTVNILSGGLVSTGTIKTFLVVVTPEHEDSASTTIAAAATVYPM